MYESRMPGTPGGVGNGSQSAAVGAVATPPDSELGQSTYTAAAKRLLPLLGVCYFLSYLDRTNVSVAALTMNKALGISATALTAPTCRWRR